MSNPRHLYEREAIARRYCEDCRFYQSAEPLGPRFAKCLKPRDVIAAVQYVTRNATNPRFCENTRDGDCGPDAKWFEPKPAPISEAAE